MVDLSGSLKLTLRVAVFLKPPLGGMAQCGWSRLMSGLWQVMHLAVFLKPPGVGEVGTLRVSMWECTTKLGTLNSKIPSLSNVA